MSIEILKSTIRACTVCHDLVDGIRPVVQFSRESTILLVGQAPGRKVHETGIPFNDPSGERLRAWMGVDKNVFYSDKTFAIVPMGFCFPGTGRSGDLPPRKECMVTWRQQVMAQLVNIKLTVVIGRYAMDYHLPDRQQKSVTEAVAHWQQYWPDIIPLPHPSPRNNRWLKNNPWFEHDVLPELKKRIASLLP